MFRDSRFGARVSELAFRSSRVGVRVSVFAVWGPSERSRLRSRIAFGTHSDQTRNALGNALGAPSVTHSDRRRKLPSDRTREWLRNAFGSRSERPRQRPRSAFGTLSAAHSERFRNAFGSNSERPRQRPRSALSNALGSPSETPLGAHSGAIAERPRQRPRNGRSELVPNPLRGRLEAILEAAWFSGPFNSLGFLFSYLYMLRLKAPLLILTYKNKKFRCADAQIYAQAAGPASFRRCTTIAHAARVRIQTVPRPRATRGGQRRAPTARAQN